MADYSEREIWHPTQIVGQLVALRRPRPDDLAAVVRWYRDPEIARLTRYRRDHGLHSFDACFDRLLGHEPERPSADA